MWKSGGCAQRVLHFMSDFSVRRELTERRVALFSIRFQRLAYGVENDGQAGAEGVR
jgi:hypothetical protein